MPVRSRLAAVVVAVVAVFVAAPGQPAAASTTCGDGSSAADALDTLFDDGTGSFAGADYQRPIELDDGRVLWLFQDVFVDGGSRLVHNAGALQDGECVTELRSSDGGPWLAGDETDPFRRWYWPLDGYQIDDDTVLVYVAKMVETGDHYLDRTTPVATWTVEIDLETMEPGPLEPAPDSSAALYGWDVETDGNHTYLFAHCYLQFGFGLIGHDACTQYVTVARQPVGEVDAPLEYWDGSGWVDDADAAANIAPVVAPDGEARYVNPMQFDVEDGEWKAITKEGDWWGDRVYFDVAQDPQGPWSTTAFVPVEPVGDPEETNTYFASFVPDDGLGVTVAISNNRWDGVYSDVYRPTARTVPERLWTPRAAFPTPRGSWLPLGATLW